MIYTVKGFGIVNNAEVDVFLELSCFFYDPTDGGNLVSGSSAFSKSSLNIWKFSVHVMLKPCLENFEHCFVSMWDRSNRQVLPWSTNEAGQRLTEFCQENTLVMANTLFQQHKRRLYTWTSPHGQYWNKSDYILCSWRWRSSIQSAKTRLGADCGSDHELFIAKFRQIEVSRENH